MKKKLVLEINWKNKVQYYAAFVIWWSCCLSPALLVTYIYYQDYLFNVKIQEIRKEFSKNE